MKRSLSFFSSIFIAVCYIGCTLLAYMIYPSNYSPLKNWLSDLGSRQLNPQGAAFYNTGIVLAGIGLTLFFVGLSKWKIAGNKRQNIMLFLTQLFGLSGAVSMVMSAVFPITHDDIHSFWSALFYILTGTAFAFSVAAMRYDPDCPRWLLIVGGLVAFEDMIWSLVLNTYLMEWITVGMFLFYVLLLGITTNQYKDLAEEINISLQIPPLFPPRG